MSIDPQTNFLSLAQVAIAWAQARSLEVMALGRSLSDSEILVARKVGVSNPERIRMLVLPELPLPDDPELREAALASNLLGSETNGLTLDHAIYLREGCCTRRLLAHECRHVYQYEQAGSIAAFLLLYLQQIDSHGYDHAPYELDAKLHEVDG